MYNKITWYSLCTRHHCWQLLQSLQEYHEVAINHFPFGRWRNLGIKRLKNCPWAQNFVAEVAAELKA